ncbi:aliphatic sulfonate ABC transporter substrate-binding protein [Pseudomonas sp. GX19020]|uniref:aliphatic sulfonate ABC transporter substrate-binding protein n=1 Tax=Pseudomonadota TaxID=1224 RepID=UPI00089AE1CF|nr:MULTISPECIES: aliphatic sulfonate ABC transporter substrate-binding protein [Pseudomonadota]MCL4069345.1 aliphatic sulfonate ABC transporter substrate-binding protein [Pseudomonas sp. GX19020]SED26122.1 sulfonate transport system substrate-binding protein [Rhodobacter sp. 24-YEA-8]
MITRRHLLQTLPAASLVSVAAPGLLRAQSLSELKIDFATYNPVSLLLKSKGWLEEEFASDKIAITWVQSAGSNKALEFLSGSAIDFGSTAGSAALVSKINGNPIRSIYSYSRPEWTALVTRAETGITSVADLKGKTVAVTRGTDPHIFLIRALADQGLSESDITTVLLQHADGKTALLRGDVDAWAGLDPIMASAEVEDGASLFFRNVAANTYGILNVREAFLAEQPEVTTRVLTVYERARKFAVENPDELKAVTVEVTGLPEAVIEKQLNERTDLSDPRLGAAHRDAILAAGIALQKAGVIEAGVDVTATVDGLIDDRLPTA